MRISDWSSDVCSSDLGADAEIVGVALQVAGRRDPWSERREGVARLAAGRIETAGPARNVPHAGVVHDRIAENVIPRLVRRDVAAGTADHDRQQIGRASCRERVCQYVELSVVAVALKKKKKKNK